MITWFIPPIFTGRNEVLAKVIFLHLSVILFTGGVSAPNFRGGVCSKFWGGVSAPNFPGGCLLQILGGFLQFSEYGQRSAGTHPTGMHSCSNNSLMIRSRDLYKFKLCTQEWYPPLLPPANEVYRCLSIQGGCLLSGGVVACSRGAVWFRGVWSWGGCACSGGSGPGGACSRGVPGGDPPPTATAAEGTHPTGMHSCHVNCSLKYKGMQTSKLIILNVDLFLTSTTVKNGSRSCTEGFEC